jgi:hypothetical protein
MYRSHYITILAVSCTPILTTLLLHHFAGKRYFIVSYHIFYHDNVMYLTSSVSMRLQVNCERPVRHCKTQDDAPCDATATNIGNTRSRTMQQICIHLNLPLQNTCDTWLKCNGHQCAHYTIEYRASKMQYLNPSVIIDVKKSRQHKNKRHQDNSDVRLRNNYSPDVRSHIPPTTTLVQKRTSSMSMPHETGVDHDICHVRREDTLRHRSPWRWLAAYD